MKESLAKKYITIMILPHTRSRMKQLKIPAKTLYGAAIGGGLLTMVFIWFCYSYVGMAIRTSQFEELQKKNGMQKQELLKVTDEVNHLNSQMESLMVFSRRLQVMMGLDNAGETENVGGFESNEIDRFSRLYKKNQKVLLNQIESDIDQLKKDIPQQRTVHTYLNELLDQNTALLSSIPSIRPVNGGWISSSFGMRDDPFTGRKKMHYAIDIAQDRNAPVYATADGVVTYAKRGGALGKMISIDHGFYTTRYAHLSVIAVKFNQKVKRGDVIGRVGSTGRSRGLHLHYEVRMEGVPVNPEPFILDQSESKAMPN
jgi:murein DD-endopeptidase MepM/ murein hydrolase activator NlpD